MGYVYPAAIYILVASDVNITDCVFRNISNNNNYYYAGVMNYDMYTSYGRGYYNFSNNVFLEISSNDSALIISGNFNSLTFSLNNFYNVSSFREGGV
jgi:hypothetical protein